MGVPESLWIKRDQTSNGNSYFMSSRFLFPKYLLHFRGVSWIVRYIYYIFLQAPFLSDVLTFCPLNPSGRPGRFTNL